MLQIDKAPEKASKLSLKSHILKIAKELGMNISQTVETLLADEVKRRYWAQWSERNKDAISTCDARIARPGAWCRYGRLTCCAPGLKT